MHPRFEGRKSSYQYCDSVSRVRSSLSTQTVHIDVHDVIKQSRCLETHTLSHVNTSIATCILRYQYAAEHCSLDTRQPIESRLRSSSHLKSWSDMLPAVRPLLRPLPLIGLSGGLLFAAALSSTTTRTTAMGTPSSKQWPIKEYTPRHETFPYRDEDFLRQDPSTDSQFYSSPRFVTHIDDRAIADLRDYYDTVLPRKGKILDFCSSWVSHYPTTIEDAAARGDVQVVGLGMSKPELEANKVLNSGRLVIDLNVNPDIASALHDAKAVDTADDSTKLDASTNVVSTDYLIQPVAVLRSLRQVTKPQGTVHLTISNRCFPTKAISRWLRVGEEERLLMVGDFLHEAGWRRIEIVELSSGKVAEGEQVAPPQGFQGLMAWMGMDRRDPLWVVRAVNE